MKAWRIILAAAGLVLVSFGVFRILSQTPLHNLFWLAVWLLSALVIHDAIVAPSVVGVGWLLRRHVPDRGRRFIQLALIMSAMVTVVALPMIYLRGSQPPVKALLLRNYGANLILILGGIVVVSLVLYVVQVVRDRQRPPAESRSLSGSSVN